MVIENIHTEFAYYLIDNFHTQLKAAEHFGVGFQLISDIKRGRKPPTKAMLKEMGIIKKVIFVKV